MRHDGDGRRDEVGPVGAESGIDHDGVGFPLLLYGYQIASC